jgi:hypothetical protein
MRVLRPRRPAVRRLFLGPAEREEFAHNGFVQRDGKLDVVDFTDGTPTNPLETSRI